MVENPFSFVFIHVIKFTKTQINILFSGTNKTQSSVLL